MPSKLAEVSSNDDHRALAGRLNVRKMSGHCGAEILDVDLAHLTDTTFKSVEAALFTHGVIFFRDQDLSPEAHLAFARRFGPINTNRFFRPVEGYPNIAEVRTEPQQTTVIGGTWHADHTYDPIPAMASVLVAREVPDYGGDTLFASAAAAYRHLSEGLRRVLDGLWAWHSDGSFAQTKIKDARLSAEGITTPVRHPLIVAHPRTGERSIYVNGDFTTHIDGWSEAESKPMLEYLYGFISQPAFTCRFRWAPGSVAVWDNRLVQHFANADYMGQRRLMHRITIEGQPLS